NPDLTAAELTTAITASASGFADLGLGSGQVDFRAAFDHIPPTEPTFASPRSGSIVQGAVPVSLSEVRGRVRLDLDGDPWLPPTSATAGTVTTVWETWGWPNDGHGISAFACSVDGAECST